MYGCLFQIERFGGCCTRQAQALNLIRIVIRSYTLSRLQLAACAITHHSSHVSRRVRIRRRTNTFKRATKAMHDDDDDQYSAVQAQRPNNLDHLRTKQHLDAFQRNASKPEKKYVFVCLFVQPRQEVAPQPQHLYRRRQRRKIERRNGKKTSHNKAHMHTRGETNRASNRNGMEWLRILFYLEISAHNTYRVQTSFTSIIAIYTHNTHMVDVWAI